MRKSLVIFLFMLGSAQLFAQVPYLGGAGDGFATIEASAPSGLQIFEQAALEWSIYPNICSASNCEIKISGPSGSLQLQLSNAQGQVVMTDAALANTHLQLPQLTPGIYFLRIQDPEDGLRQQLLPLLLSE